MENFINTGTGTATARGMRVRMAYAIDNKQPVLCSIVSDQPLFFMDFQPDCEEDLAECAALFGAEAITRDLAALRGEIASICASVDADAATLRLSEFMSDVMRATDPDASAPIDGDYTYELQSLTDMLARSRVAAAYMECAARYGSTIRMSREVDGALYDRKEGHIYVNPLLAQPEQILLTARELRRLWQHRQGALLNPLTFHPDQAILVHRAQIADLCANMVRVAWELHLAGESAAWERLEFSPMADLVRAFARESALDFRTLNNGVAASAVFEAWFLSERCRHEDRRLIQQMLADYQGYVFDSAQTSRAVTTDLIMALGSMPFGKNYLAPYVHTICNDALFSEVRDRSNANFLWFIKFERSFREAEQELQISAHGKDHDQRDINIKNNRFGDQHEKTADIISVPFGAQRPGLCTGMDEGAAASGGGARILPFRGGTSGSVKG